MKQKRAKKVLKHIGDYLKAESVAEKEQADKNVASAYSEFKGMG